MSFIEINSKQSSVDYYALNALSSPPPEPEIEIIKPKKEEFITKAKITRVITISKKILKDVDGKDKIMKIIQYFIKILLHYKLAKAKYWSNITSNFSMTRKLLRVGNAVGPIHELSTDSQSLNPLEKFSLINDVVNTIADDIFCFYKLGIFGKYLGDKSEIIAAYCWFIAIIIDLKSNIKSYNKLKKSEKSDSTLFKLYVSEISIVKLLMDFIFCSCDIWQPSYSGSVQAWTGFFSGTLAGYKLLIKHSS